MLTLDEIKTYCRIDGPDDDAAIMQVFLPAAKAYVDNAITNKAVLTDENEPYKFLILLLINHWYNERDVVGEMTGTTPVLYRSLMQQLQAAP